MSEATGKKAVLQLDGKEIELPIYSWHWPRCNRR